MPVKDFFTSPCVVTFGPCQALTIRDLFSLPWLGGSTRGSDPDLDNRCLAALDGPGTRIRKKRRTSPRPGFLILDEPTSGLDTASERSVMAALRIAAAGRTTLTIAHRMRTVRYADRIIVMERGRIVEDGTHSELLRLEGRYAALCELQLVND